MVPPGAPRAWRLKRARICTSSSRWPILREVVESLEVPAPRTLGRYQLHGEIASGGMAVVHFGRLVGAAGFTRPVAIKRLHLHLARDPEFVQMFLEEARLAARITHPNVVSTLDVVADEGEVFLVMEYVRGATLSQLLKILRQKEERMPPLVALGIVAGMLQGLHAAHEAKNDRGERLNLVHRDVSPQNALVGADGVTRVLDFGIAKAVGRLYTTREGQLKGKLAYMAPEQVLGEPVSARTDIYAASVVLWEALTGERLFAADNEGEVLAKLLHSEVPRPTSVVPRLPAFLDTLVLRGLKRDPAQRYPTARAMAEEIDAYLGVASPAQIGEWVERTAADSLAESSARLAAIERSGSRSVEDLVTAPPASTDNTSAVGAMSKKVGKDGDPEQTVVERRVRRWKRVAPLALAGLLCIGVTFSFLWRGPQEPTAREVKRATAPTQAASPPSVARPSQVETAAPEAAHPAVRVEDLPVATAAALASAVSVAPLGSSAPAAAPAAKARPAVTAGAEGATHVNPPSPTPAAAAKGGDCDPPFTVDAKGHTHFKPACL